MAYVTDMTSEELRHHMKRLVNMEGWREPLFSRLWKEIEEQYKINSDLLEALEELRHQSMNLCTGKPARCFDETISRVDAAISKAKGEE